MYDFQDIRELLIDTMHSNEDAIQYFVTKLNDKEMLKLLVRIAVDDEGYGGDAPVATGDYIHQYPVEWLVEYEDVFLSILRREYSDVRTEDIAIALAKFGSAKAKPLIEGEIEELKWGPRCDRLKLALDLYEKENT